MILRTDDIEIIIVPGENSIDMFELGKEQPKNTNT